MSRSRSRLPWLVAVAAVLTARLALQVDLLDDAFITLRAVRHFVAGEGLHFNLGADDHVLSTLAWPLLLALLRALGLDLVLAARLLGSVAELALLLAFGRYVNRLSGRPAAGPLAAIFLLGNPVLLFPSHGGMETALVLTAMVVALERELAGRPRAALVAAATVVWLRFDGILFFGVLLIRILCAREMRREEAGELRARAWSSARVRELMPGLGVLAGFIVFSLWQFGTLLPSSVAAKIGEIGLGREWIAGVGRVALEFVRAVVGLSSYWYEAWTPLVALVPFLLVGAVGVARDCETRSRWVSLALFTLCYLAAYVGSGRDYAINFPWYFAPPLLLSSALAATGAAWVGERILRATRVGSMKELVAARLPALAIALWALLMSGPLAADARRLGLSFTPHRERAYAAAALWLSEVAGPATIAANEIGALGFFAHPDTEILDLWGIARRPEERGLDYRELVARRMPLAIVSRIDFRYQRGIEQALPGRYGWVQMGAIWIGIRSEELSRLESRAPQLEEIYRLLDLGHEPAATPRPRSAGLRGDS